MATLPSAVEKLLKPYDKNVQQLALAVRKLIQSSVKGMDEHIHSSPTMLGYGFGKGYTGMLFTIILSKKEVKLGFYKGTELPDPAKLLTGAGKVHKHVPIRSLDMIKSAELHELIAEAHVAYLRRMEQRKK
jgi:hypothetical protein